MRTIKANILSFNPTKVSLSTFVFDNGNVNSDDKTVDKENGEGNNNTDNDNDNVNDQDFYGIAI